MSNDLKQLKRLVREFRTNVSGDLRAQVRVKAVNTFLNGGNNLKLLEDDDIISVWESIFFALWHAEMGRGCEEIIAAVDRACVKNYRLTRAGFQIIAKKWYGIDQYRIDKISHLSRHLLVILIEQQITIWFRSCKKRKLGTDDISCKQLIRRTLNDVVRSYGLCYFLLEISGEEISKSLTRIYDRLGIVTGKFEVKANLIVFIYKQIINFASNIELDSRLLRTFDLYVVKRLIEEIISNESQLTQILVSLRLYQAIDVRCRKPKNSPKGRSKALLERWSALLQEIHENCINAEYFPASPMPIKDTIHMDSVLKNK